MSSWANRGIFSKRNLSQVPEMYRPVIVPRAERSEVIFSESFQRNDPRNDLNPRNDPRNDPLYDDHKENQLIYPTETAWKPNYQLPTFPGYSSTGSTFNSRQMTARESTRESARESPAKELIHNEKTYVFVILRNIQKASDNDLWLSCYHSIRKFYTNQIVIIDDNSTINTVNGRLVNTEIIQSEFNGAGEILPYYYFQRNKWADTMIFLHDSMVLHRTFTEDELDHEVVFHWHFVDNDGSFTKKCVSLISSLNKSKELEEYIASESWIGCFGGGAIIDGSVVDMLEEKYNLSKLVTYIRTRKQREIVERIIGIILSYEKKVKSNFGDIMKYPAKFEANTLQIATHNVLHAGYNTAIIKLWRGR